jgi:predicted HAD superfamily Cof-like phosphohydrolase
MYNPQRQMLIDCRDQFAMYAQEHRAKASRYKAERLGCSDEVHNAELDKLIGQTIAKAEVNEEMVSRIQETLTANGDVLMATAEFGTIAYADGISPKNQQTQIGVHFEEVAEMCNAMQGTDRTTQKLLDDAEFHLIALGDHLKNSDPGKYSISRIEFLDAICDQLVTATLSGVLHNLNVVPALAEVNRSNYSKLTDGVMAKDPVTAKWIKGPNYRAPSLRRYI